MKYESDSDREARIQHEQSEMDELRAELHDEDVEKGLQWTRPKRHL